MQIVVSILGGILIVYLFFNGLAELGISTSGMNPILRYRRRKWKELSRNPIYNIESPLEMTALLLVAIAKTGGDIHPGAKLRILTLFQDVFHLDKKDAAALLIASTYLLQDGVELHGNLKQVMQKSLQHFTPEQAASANSMIERIAGLDTTWNPAKEQLLEKIKNILSRSKQE
ncbi:MAG TPA: hypothetical protein VFX02_02910 [Gammaproteobacteria bacterium]|nr:hypothetical protein [Gammaproteobacteria bacterium]